MNGVMGAPRRPHAASRRFASLFADHYEEVVAYARRRVGPDAAQDVVAETFLVAWRRLGDVPPDVLPWLFGVARRIVANQRRSAARNESLRRRLADQPAARGRDPAEALANGEAVVAALRRLPDPDREALMLAAWEGLDAQRAGLTLGCSARAYTVRLHRARQRLERILEDMHRAGEAPDVHIGPTRRGNP